MRIKSFNALRPDTEYARQVASVPYDTVNRAEAAALAANNPMSFLHVSRAEIDLPENINPYDNAVYEQALENFISFQNRGIFIQEPTACLYIYRLTVGAQSQNGIIACCHVDDYEKNIIKKHEKTRTEKEHDRLRVISQLNAHIGPVFLTYRNRPEIDELVNMAETEKPLYDLVAPGGVSHTIWRVQKSEPIVQAFRNIPCCYIADGHHRAASALSVARERRKANPENQESKEYNWFLTALFPANQLHILAYNRCVCDLNGKTKKEFLKAVQTQFTLTAKADPSPKKNGHISMYLDGQWYGLIWNDKGSETDDIAFLDVSVLQNRLLGPVLGIHNPRTNKRIEFIGGIRGTDELEKRVDSGKAAVAFSMFPASVNQLMAVSDADQIMPPKSTWFEPKPRSGLLIHTF